jgi:glycosyltransferase involved in cell wall biosynthesis
VTVVVPCYDEGPVVDHLVEALVPVLVSTGRTFEIVLVDDGSRDNTLERMRAVSQTHEHVHYIALSRNFGKEAAMLAGMSRSHGDVTVVMDADLQHPPTLIPSMLELIDAGHDQVVARRDRRGDPAVRTAVSRLYYRLVNGLIDVRLEDGVGDFRALSRPAVRAVLSLGETNRFSKGLFAWVGFPTTYIDYSNVARVGGESKWGSRSLFNYGLDSIISFNSKPLRLAIHVGMVISVLAVLYGLWVGIDSVINRNPVPGYTTLLCAIVGLGGLQIIMLGVLGEYVGRIYMETKQRPHFLVREVDGHPAHHEPTIGCRHHLQPDVDPRDDLVQ